MSIVPAARPNAATVHKNFKMRVGQKVRLKLKGVDTPLAWSVVSGKKLIKLRKNGTLKAKGTGKAVINVVFRGVNYRFCVKIRVKKKNQSKELRIIEQYVPPKRVKESNIIMIGDSRFQGIHSVVGGSAVWICAAGEGIYWLRDSVIPLLDSMEVKGKAVVFNLGVNDLWESSAYIQALKSIGNRLKSRLATVYFMTVNPVDSKKAKNSGYNKTYKISNQKITAFNDALIKGLSGYGIINTYDYLTKYSFETVDGIHYTEDTYKMIYSFLCSKILSQSNTRV